MMKVYELAKAVDPYVVSMRRYFHENPELSNQEDKTIERIGQELDAMGIRYEVVPKGGIIGYIEGTKPGKGKTVLLRADCDALPVLEKKDNLAGPRVCCSKVDGVMHACGHDGHTAILLGAAKILNEHKDEIAGKIILFFERAEENGGGIPQIAAHSCCPGGNGGDNADWGSSAVDDISQLRPGNSVMGSDWLHDGADSKTIEVIVDENEAAQQPGGQHSRALAFQLAAGPVAVSNGATSHGDDVDQGPQQTTEQNDI